MSLKKEVEVSSSNVKESTESETQEEYSFSLEDDADSVRSFDSVGISLDDIIEGEKDSKGIIEKLEAPHHSVKVSQDEYEADEEEEEALDEFNISDIFIKLLVYWIILSAWGLIVFYLNTPLEDGLMGAKGSEIIISFLTSMSLLSYFQCSNTNSIHVIEKAPQWMRASRTKACKFCKKWKPERSHHCNHCGKCVMKMDHHCPWICNCVGYRNHKSFLLFCLYVGIGSLYFDYRIFYFFFLTTGNSTTFQYPGAFLIYALLCVFIILPVGLLVLYLAGYHFMLAMNNVTTIEDLEGDYIKDSCSLLAMTRKSQRRNKYDKGVWANLWEFFGETYLWWWWPTTPSKLYKGLIFSDQSEETHDDTEENLEKRNAQKESQKAGFNPKSLKEVDKEQMFKLAEDFVHEKSLRFGEYFFEYGKRKDKSFQESTIQT